jgi:RNA polymerase sigma-70 factor (ECF subfamily)
VVRDHVLLGRAKRYDEEALVALYDDYAPLIYAYIYRRVGDDRLAENLVGEAFVRVLSAIRSERAWGTSFRARLYRIAHSVAVDHHERGPDQVVLALGVDRMAGERQSSDAPRKKASRQRWVAAVRELTSAQQEVLVLCFGERLPGLEVAEVMGKSISAVQYPQHRAQETLRKEVVGDGGTGTICLDRTRIDGGDV